jgi:hypothetical protein
MFVLVAIYTPLQLFAFAWALVAWIRAPKIRRDELERAWMASTTPPKLLVPKPESTE